nr:immunoglobulin heavy chain junction region [Mus musculus]NSM03910.1 immunoglobulin heavy chain junction region [Mus musculus]NSM05012.1 immunoglobulin heavy chain junction region [Mus musculus]NSM06008.1 immunoglobulin heavy chain junction region [Mus musculus]NSM08389.1 immunoglobulin heavy chain junction region [Mus musculus]
CARYGYGMDYW